MKDNLLKRYGVLIAPAILGAHASAPDGIGFRQRDVKWLVECFANWIESSFEDFEIKNTQIQRYLNNLIKDGYARSYLRKSKPRYFLTPIGLVELLHRAIGDGYFPQIEHFYFLYTFLVNYKPRIEYAVKAEKKRFPYTLQLELQELFNYSALLDRQIYHVEQELKKINKRIEDQIGASKLTSKIIKTESSYKKIVKEVENEYPYIIYTKKPLRQTLSETTQKHGLWELTIGGMNRTKYMWGFTKLNLENQLKDLKTLKDLKVDKDHY